MKRWGRKKDQPTHEDFCRLAEAMAGEGWFSTPEDAWSVIQAVTLERMARDPDGFTCMADLVVGVAAKIGQAIKGNLAAEIEDCYASMPPRPKAAAYST